MAREIERKFLVTGDGWRADADDGRSIRQAYLARTGSAHVRVRIVDDRDAWLTIKSASKSAGGAAVREEFEYPIPADDARALFALRDGNIVKKRRFRVPADDGLCWEIDVFDGDNAGLVLAEIELGHEAQPVDLPDWISKEVTGNPAYYNAALALTSTWRGS